MSMRNSSALGVVAATLIALYPGHVWAQEPTEEATVTVRWPRSVIARPLTLPGGVFQVGVDVIANNDFSALADRVVAGYGINDQIEVNVFYLSGLKDFDAKGYLDVNVGYAVLRGAAGGKLEVIARAQAGYSPLLEGLDPRFLGAHAQYNLSDKLALITPGQQLRVVLEGDGKPIDLSLPVAVAFQATPEVYVQLDTSLGTVEFADSANAFIFADSTPVAITAIYNVQQAIDVSAGISLNVTPPEGTDVADTIAFLLGVRYYGGTL